MVKDRVTVVICWNLHFWCGRYNPGGSDVVLSQEAAYNLFDLGVNLWCFSLTQETAYNKVNLGVTSSYCYSLSWGAVCSMIYLLVNLCCYSLSVGAVLNMVNL